MTIRPVFLPSGALALGLCAALLFAAPASAQDEGPANELTAPGLDSTALALFDASVAFQEGRYESSVAHFRRAHALSARPELLYRIGSAADRAGMHEVALDAYRRYLAEAPESALHERARERLAVLEQQRTGDPRTRRAPEQRAAAPRAVEPPAPPAPSSPDRTGTEQPRPARATPERATAPPATPASHAPLATGPA